MRRRSFLAALGSAGLVGTAGCGAIRSDETLSDPTLQAESPLRRSLSFRADGEEVGSLGVNGNAIDGVIDLQTQIWHRSGTLVESIQLDVWTEPQESIAQVALVSPVEGDSSPPPSVTLSTPSSRRGTRIEVTDLDDLADETISTLDLLVRPISDDVSTLVIDGTIELGSNDWFGTDYTLEGRLSLDLSERGSQ